MFVQQMNRETEVQLEGEIRGQRDEEKGKRDGMGGRVRVRVDTKTQICVADCVEDLSVDVVIG